MKSILERYTFREVVTPFSLAVLVIVILMLIQRMILITEWVVNRGVPLIYVLQLIGLMLPFFLTLVIPVALLLATLLAVNRLSADSEITALKAAGISVTRLLPPVILLGVLCMAITAFLNFSFIPRAAEYSHKLSVEVARKSARAAINEKGFVQIAPKVVMYVDSMEGDVLKGIMLARFNSKKKNTDASDQIDEIFVFAREGRIALDPHGLEDQLHLTDGEIQTFERDKDVFRSIKFGTFDSRIELNDEKDKSGGIERGTAFEVMDLSTLKKKKVEINDRLNKAKAEPGNDKAAQMARRRFRVAIRQIDIARHQKYSLPFACVILALWGVPLGIQPPRTTRHQGIITSIFLTLAYYVMVSGGKILAVKGFIPAFWALWSPNFIVFISGVWFIYRVANDRPMPLSNATARIAEWGAAVAARFRRREQP